MPGAVSGNDSHLASIAAVVVARNEAAQLAECLDSLRFADETIVLLDRSTDDSAAIAEQLGATVIEGAWAIEGERRNTALAAAKSDWIVEVDADERVPPALAEEMRARIQSAEAPGYFLVPFLNYIGDTPVPYGWSFPWGVRFKGCLFSRGSKHWGPQRIHPAVTMPRKIGTLNATMTHFVDRDIDDMLERLRRYTRDMALDARDAGKRGTLLGNLRRGASRFFKAYVSRQGYRCGLWGFLIALFAGLVPVIVFLRLRLELLPDTPEN